MARLEAWHHYHEALEKFEKTGLIKRPAPLPNGHKHNAHMYQILLNSNEARSHFISQMKAKKITTPFHYVPLHSAPAGKKFGRTVGDMTVTNDISERLVRLPMFAGIDAEQNTIIEKVLETLQEMAG